MAKVILLIMSLCIASVFATRCTNLGLYTMPDENSCTKYYFCLHGQEIASECADGLFYDPISGTCNLETNTVCLLGSCPVDNVGTLTLVPSYENCSNYYACIRGIASKMSCSEGLLYNPTKKACDFAERVTCALPISKSSYSVTDCPLTGVAKIPHTEDCSKFYICISGKSAEYRCAENSLYNPKNQRCDRPEKTKCFSATDVEKIEKKA